MTSRSLRARHLIKEIDERCGGRELDLLSVSMTRGVIPRTEVTDKEARADDLSNYKVCRQGDIVVNRMSAYQGALGMSHQAGIVSPDYIVFRPFPGVEPRWLHHVMRSTWFVSEMSARIRGIGSIGTGNVRTPRVSSEEIRDIRVSVPEAQEQRAIADFLDSETARIDALIGRKTNLIGLLEQRWRVEVRNRMDVLSESWGVIQLRHLVQCLDGRRVPLSAAERENRQGLIPYYGASGVVDYVDEHLFDEVLVLLGEDGAQLGAPDYPISQVVSGKTWVNNHAHVLRPRKVDPEFLTLFLNTFDRVPYISGGLREKITQDDMNRIRVPNVSLDSQRDEAARLSGARTRSESLVVVLNHQIELLREHRQALITAAVTGQIDIPGVAA